MAALPGVPPQLARTFFTHTPQVYHHRGPATSAPHLLPFATGPPRTA